MAERGNGRDVSGADAAGVFVDEPVTPDYSGPCVCNVVPAILDPSDDPPDWMPSVALEADRLVLLVLDGVGWHQLNERRHLVPTLSSMVGGPIRTILPTTTATALTSIATGTTPGEHGVVGYRMAVDSEVLNVLRWTTASGDARRTILPDSIQSIPAFLGHHPPAVTRAEFATSGFSAAHLAGVRFRGWRVASTIVTEIAIATRANEPFVYAYYDGVDKVAHEYGLGEHYDAELAAADRLVADVLSVLPPGTALLITADHGQVDTGDDLHHLDPEVLAHVALQSGEARFRWLHARPGRREALLEAAVGAHADRAWIKSRDELVDAGWFGPKVTDDARGRLGDVALVARGTAAFLEPTDTGPYHLVGRHGSATPAELDVPLLATVV